MNERTQFIRANTFLLFFFITYHTYLIELCVTLYKGHMASSHSLFKPKIFIDHWVALVLVSVREGLCDAWSNWLEVHNVSVSTISLWVLLADSYLLKSPYKIFTFSIILSSLPRGRSRFISTLLKSQFLQSISCLFLSHGFDATSVQKENAETSKCWVLNPHFFSLHSF